MTKTIKKSVAFLSAAVMVMAMLLYFPSGIFSDIDFGLSASAADITPSQPTNGDGSEGNPYKIGTAAELYWFANTVNSGNTDAYAVLTKDITVNSNLLSSLEYDTEGNVTNGGNFTSWTPIGNNSNRYTGTFDGKGFTVSGLYHNSSTDYVGLFGYVNGGSVSNVGVVDSYFKGKRNVGGVCGVSTGKITNCYNTGNVRAITIAGSLASVGGVCGASNGTITNCYNTGNVTANGFPGSPIYVGGVCGNNAGEITNCYNKGTVTATGETASVGGVCGDNAGEITNCYNKGTVTATGETASVGGVCGDNLSGTITNCYFLEGTATKGIGQTPDTDLTESKTAEEFSNGTVCTALTYHSHKINGICALCGGYEPATLTTDKYDINGDNNKDTVYEISNAGQLYWFADKVKNDNTNFGKANAVLTADITVNTGVLDASGNLASNTSDFTSWTPIGNSSNQYTGTFDGKNHTVSGLYFNNSSTNYVGLFGYVGSNGKVSNVGVVDSYFNVAAPGDAVFASGVCGRNYGTITNCYNTGNVTGTGDVAYVGGVCGNNFSTAVSTATITNCYNKGNVTATGNNAYVGGVSGNNFSTAVSTATITNCYNKGNVTATGNNAVVGGVSGNNNGTITNCYYLAGTADENGGKNETQFNSGEVAYLLQSGQTAVNGTIPEVWGQKIGTDNYPVLGGQKVYKTTGCVTYNNSGTTGKKAHSFSNGVCSVCKYVCKHESGYTNNDDSTHICKICNKTQNHSFVYSDNSQHKCKDCGSAVAHSGGMATCLKKAECGVCNEEYGELAVHNYVNEICEWCGKPEPCQHVAGTSVKTNVVESTCTEYGSYTRKIYCAKCGELMVKRDYLTVPKGHTYSSGGICKTCGKLENGKDGFKSASITLTDGVIINYNLLLSDTALADAGAYINFTSPQGLDTKIMLSDGVAENGRYRFSLKLRPDQMADVVTAQVVYSDDSKGNSVEYSVTKYAENQSGTADTKTLNLINAMLYYGAATQNYTGNNTDNPANGNVDSIYNSNVQISDDYKMSLNGTVNGIKIKGANLIAGSLTTIRVKYEVTAGSISDFKFTCDGAELTPVKEGAYYYVYISDISPDNIDKMYSIVVTDKNNNSRTLKYSALTYAKSVIEDTTGKYSESLVNMMKALYYYNKAADSYSN